MTITAKAVLRDNLLFRDLAETTLDRIATLAIRRNYCKGTTVFSQGDAGDALYAVTSGQVRIYAHNPDGREVFLSIMEKGDTFGEIAVLDGRERTASAICITDASLLFIRRADLMTLMERDPALPVHLLSVLCQRLRWTSELVEEAAFLDLPSRLATRLLQLSADHGNADRQGTTLQISQEDLANFLSVSRQVVNQHLQEWRNRGWIALARSRIVIRDSEALKAVSRGEQRPIP